MQHPGGFWISEPSTVWLQKAQSRSRYQKDYRFGHTWYFKHTCLGLILFEANEVDKCSDVNIAQHIRKYPFERKSAHESCVLQLEAASHP